MTQQATSVAVEDTEPTPAEAARVAWYATEVPVWVLGAVASWLIYLCSTQGLFHLGWLQQPAVLAGAVAGLVVSTPWLAGLVAGGAVSFAMVIAPPWLFGDLALGAPQWWRWAAVIVIWAVASAVIVSGGRALVSRVSRKWSGVRYEWLVAGACLAMILLGVWFTAGVRQGSEHLTAWLDGPAVASTRGDTEFYLRTRWLMRDRGMEYYQAYRQAHNESLNWHADPSFFLSYRLPPAFWALARMSGSQIAFAAVMAAMLTVLGATALALARARPALALVAATATAAVAFHLASTRFVLTSEFWAIPLVVCGVALFEWSAFSARWRWVVVAAVAAVVAASVLREISMLVAVAGLGAAVFGPVERRRFDIAAWATGLAVIAAALLAHWLAVGSAVSGEGAGWLFHPSLMNVAAGLQWGTLRLAGDWWQIVVLVLLAFAGIGVQKGSQRVFTMLAVGLPLVGFALLYNMGFDPHNEAVVNYWGSLINPVIYGLVPWALATLPGGAAMLQRTGVTS